MISPFVQAFHYSLTDWTGVSPEFDYRRAAELPTGSLDDSVFLQALRNNLVLLVVMPIAVDRARAALRVPAQRRGSAGARRACGACRGSGFYKLAFFLPQVLSVPVIAVIWAVIIDPTADRAGQLASSSSWASGSSRLAVRSRTSRCGAWCGCWSGAASGFYLVLFNAAMSSIPRDIFEAALIDGAGRVATFVRVTVPLLWDTIQTVVGLPRASWRSTPTRWSP